MSTEIHPFASGKWQKNLNVDSSSWVNEPNYFGYVPSRDSKTLFLGTFPTYDVVNKKRYSGNMEFFYGSTTNQFWRILSWVTGSALTSEYEYISLLQSNKLAITDILFKVDRSGENSGDSDIKMLQYNDVGQLLNRFSNINSIILTSGGKSPIRPNNANSAGVWLYNCLAHFGHDPGMLSKAGYLKSFALQTGREVAANFLLSPSNAANISLEGIIRRHQLSEILMSFLSDKPEISSCNRLRILQYAYILKRSDLEIESSISKCLSENNHLLKYIFR